MNAYTPLFQIHCKHEYFSNGDFSGARLIPTHETKQTMKSVGILEKGEEAGIKLYYSSNTGDLLRGDSNPMQFSFLLEIQDPYFMQRSDLPVFTPAEKLLSFFYESTPEDFNAPAVLLHDSDYVRENDLVLLEESQQVRNNIYGIVTIELDVQQFIDDPAADILNFEIRFQNRAVYWRYKIINTSANGNNQTYAINSSDPVVSFSEPDTIEMPDGTAAVAITSGDLIRLKEKYDFTLQLVSSNLQLTLPYPDPAMISLDTDGVFYTDIYIYV